MNHSMHLAQLLRNASESGIAIPSLYKELNSIKAAYAVQSINTEIRVSNGARIIGKKIGLTSLAVQKQLGVDQPDFGILFNDMEVLNGLSVSASTLLQPKAEVEIAFVLGEDLDVSGMTIVDLIAAIDYALPAIEIVGSRIQNWDINIYDTIADNASASHFVLGHTPKTLDEFDMVGCNMQMMKNGQKVSSGRGAACLGSPLNAMLWLANKMASLGQPLQAGEVILTGALGPMTDLVAGDELMAEIDGLGSVSVTIGE